MKGLAWLKEEAVKEVANVAKTCYVPDYRHGYSDAVKRIGELIDQVEQPALPTVPDFVADVLAYRNDKDESLFGIMQEIDNSYEGDVYAQIKDWINSGNEDAFVRAWLDGYTDEEKKYCVELPTSVGRQYLYRLGGMDIFTITGMLDERELDRYEFTKQEINNIDPKYMAFAVPIDEVHE